MRDNSSKTIKPAMEKSSIHSKIKSMSGNLNTTKDTVKAYSRKYISKTRLIKTKHKDVCFHIFSMGLLSMAKNKAATNTLKTAINTKANI